MRGTVRKITMPRRLVADLMHASVRVPFVTLSRPLYIRTLIEARAQAAQPPGWAAIFVKAFALVAKDEPSLRTLFIKWPVAHFYELPAQRRLCDDRAGRGRRGLRAAAEGQCARRDAAPRGRCGTPAGQGHAIDQVPAFRKMMKQPGCRYRCVVCSGRLASTGVAACQLFRQLWGDLGGPFGGGELHALGPGPFVLSYGRVTADQTIDVVIRWDHRITDAALIAKALTRLEQVLNTEIAAELRTNRQQTEPKSVRAVAT